MNKWKESPIVSGVIVVLNIIIFIICTFTGDLLYNKGRLDAWNVLVQGEHGRILWSLFLHADINHICNNMLILFFLGAMIEKEIGHIRYAVFYFLSGICGNLLSLARKAALQESVGSIGASGAVFGLDGVLLALVLFSPRKMENVTPARVIFMIFYSLYNGFVGTNIDNAAHIGGLLTGFFLGFLMCMAEKRKQKFPHD